MQTELDLVAIDPSIVEYEFRCIKAQQPIGDIYVAALPVETLTKITYFDVRRVLQEKRDVEKYLGIQRPLEPRRVEALEKYVGFVDATFPTSVILSVDEDYASYDEDNGVMRLTNVGPGSETPTIAIARIAKVLDGQHRIAGLLNFRGERFDVLVTIFVGADIADQAHIFATVNLEQTKVNKSLVYDLFSLARSRSPQKTCHNIAVALDRDPDGALFKRVKRLGFGTVGRTFEPITQANFVESLLPLVSSEPKMDRDTLLRGGILKKAASDELQKTPFRNLFVDERDLDIAEIVSNYFSAVRSRWPSAWADHGRGMVLNRTNGFRALMRFLRIAYLRIAEPGEVPTAERFLGRVLELVQIRDGELTTENFPPGTSGEARLLRVFRGQERL